MYYKGFILLWQDFFLSFSVCKTKFVSHLLREITNHSFYHKANMQYFSVY